MYVHIIGPNLRDQSKGDFHVHAKGCADVTRSPLYRSPDHQWDRENAVEVASMVEVAEHVYSDQINEGSMTAEDGVADMWFAPCTGDLPMRTSQTPDMPAPQDQHVVISGNPVDGFSYYGPFASSDDAVRWAADNTDDTEWWVATLAHPTT